MPEIFDGRRIARQGLAEEGERRTGFLDLSQLDDSLASLGR
jgi:hypothetical protein